jgi:hypothetical protein
VPNLERFGKYGKETRECSAGLAAFLAVKLMVLNILPVLFCPHEIASYFCR